LHARGTEEFGIRKEKKTSELRYVLLRGEGEKLKKRANDSYFWCLK
jgi:hypothetical protein